MNWSIKHFKEITTNELYDIFTVRISTFVMEQNCHYQDADGKDLKAYHIQARNENDDLVAYARILPPGVSYDDVSIGRVLTIAAVRNTGTGKDLMSKSMIFIKEKWGAVPVCISAQCYLIKFYESFGFVCQGEEYFEDDIPHIQMIFA